LVFPKISLVPLLRWLALLEIVIGPAAVIVLAATSYTGVATAAIILTGIKGTAFIAILLYSFSYVSTKVTDMKTVFSISIQQLLRCAIIIILALGLAELALNILTAIIATDFLASVFGGIFSTITFTVILYSGYLLIQTKKAPAPKKPAAPKKAVKSPIDDSDWVDNLLKEVDKPPNP